MLPALDWFAELASGDDRRAERASEALARLGPRSLPRLLQLTQSDSADHRWSAARSRERGVLGRRVDRRGAGLSHG